MIKIGSGLNSNVYKISDSLCYKEFKKDCQIPLCSSQYNIILELRKLKDILYAYPKNLYSNDYYLTGYTMDYIKGYTLNKISNKIELSSLIASIKTIKKTIEVISKKNLYLYDLHSKNIIFNNNLYLIDLDNSCYVNINFLELYIKNMFLVYDTIVGSLGNMQIIDNGYLRIINNLEAGNNDNYEDALKYLIKLLEMYSNQEIKTIGQFKRSLKVNPVL